MPVLASIYRLPEPSRSGSAIDLWSLIAQDVEAEFSDRYWWEQGKRFRICIKDQIAVSPDRKLLRYRTIEASIRRKRGCPTLLDLAVGNLFSWANSPSPYPVDVAHQSAYATWVRHASQVPLLEHVQLSQRFLGDILDAGWLVEAAPLKHQKLLAPIVQSATVQFEINGQKITPFLRRPWKLPGADHVAIVSRHSIYSDIRTKIGLAIKDLFGGSWNPAISLVSSPIQDGVNLFVLEDDDDLDQDTNFRDVLRALETEGCRFKLSRRTSLNSAFAVKNIVFDLFNMAGGRPWGNPTSISPFCSFDAGHLASKQQSRWVRVEAGADLTLHALVMDTVLAEHMPENVLNEMWATDPRSVLCRDGRLSKERVTFERRAQLNGQSVLEVKKSPIGMIWAEEGTVVAPVQFGEAVIDEHGDLLVQTAPQNQEDSLHPVRVSASLGNVCVLATQLLHQHAVPAASIYHMSRLPGSLYYADLISKLTDRGWTKAIGRGFGIPNIIP